MTRSLSSLASATPLTLLLIFPVFAALLFFLPAAFQPSALAAMLQHPQFWGGLTLSLATGIVSTLLSLLLAIVIVATRKLPPAGEAGAMLAVPHLALAIGLVFLIAPAGLIARLLALFIGWTVPPQWVTGQDPYGITLTLALILKETPFLVFALASLLNRDDVRQALAGQMRVARSLGHGLRSVWLRIVLPQLLPRMVWPLVAVFAYGTTVVDMALVAGPTQPPTLATVIWKDLNDADPLNEARGAAGVGALSAVILFLLLVVGLLLRPGSSMMRSFYSQYGSTRSSEIAILGQIWGFWRLSYLLIGGLLILHSISGHWPFPNLLASDFRLSAWQRLASDPAPLLNSLALALCTATVALGATVAWMENLPRKYDRFCLAAAVAMLCLPALVTALGQYRLFLAVGITGTWTALFLAHVLPVAAYVFVILQGPYRGYDPRWTVVAQGLGKAKLDRLLHITWPLLKAPLLSAWAAGFAVSMAQFVPAQLAAAGRHATLPMEAITLSSGGNRALIAAAALLLMVLPLLAFLAAARLGRPRWSR